MIASLGQVSAQLPQLKQASASITYLSAPSLIALTGQTSAQQPQLIQLSLITYAMNRYSPYVFFIVVIIITL